MFWIFILVKNDVLFCLIEQKFADTAPLHQTFLVQSRLKRRWFGTPIFKPNHKSKTYSYLPKIISLLLFQHKRRNKSVFCVYKFQRTILQIFD